MSPLHAAVPLANGGVLPLADLPLLGRGHFTGALLAELGEGSRVAAYFAVPSGQELELFGVIRPGDLLTTTGEITRLQERAGMDFIDVSTTTVNQRGEVVVRATWTAIIRG